MKKVLLLVAVIATFASCGGGPSACSCGTLDGKATKMRNDGKSAEDVEKEFGEEWKACEKWMDEKKEELKKMEDKDAAKKESEALKKEYDDCKEKAKA